MTKFEQIKQSADIVQVAEYFNIKPKQCCPFPDHNEKHSSFSINRRKQRYKCFSCGKSGDVIDLVKDLLNINALEAASYINSILHLGIDLNAPMSKYEIQKYEEQRKTRDKYKKWELNTFILLTDYNRYLKTANIEEKYQNIDKLDYYIDIFISGTEEDKIWFKENNKKFLDMIKQKCKKNR